MILICEHLDRAATELQRIEAAFTVWYKEEDFGGTFNMADNGDFGAFYKGWIDKTHALMGELRNLPHETDKLTSLRRRVKNHYELYFLIMEQHATQDVLKMMSPHWKTPLELADMWIGDWRPSLLFRLFDGLKKYYSRPRPEPGLKKRAPNTGLAAVSDASLQTIKRLEERVGSEEKSLSERMRSIQLSPAKEPFLCFLEAEMGNTGWAGGAADAFDDAILPCIEELKKIFIDAIAQRKDALLGIVEALDTVQSLEYLKGLSQFLLSVRDTDLLLALQSNVLEPLEFW